MPGGPADTVPPVSASPEYVPEKGKPGPKGSDRPSLSSRPGAALCGRPERSTEKLTPLSPPERPETATRAAPSP